MIHIIRPLVLTLAFLIIGVSLGSAYERDAIRLEQNKRSQDTASILYLFERDKETQSKLDYIIAQQRELERVAKDTQDKLEMSKLYDNKMPEFQITPFYIHGTNGLELNPVILTNGLYLLDYAVSNSLIYTGVMTNRCQEAIYDYLSSNTRTNASL